MTPDTLSPDLLQRMDAYWRASNYLAVGQLYLYDNPLLRQPLTLAHIKPLVVGHWGTVPGQNFIYVHLNRVICQHGLNMLYIAGPGHGGAALVAQVYLEGSWSEVYPEVTQNLAGLRKLFMQFSFPGGISSHVAPTTPGSIHEGGELGYSLSHAFGAVFDNPELIAACVVGDGEAETGPLATAWHSNKLLDPVHDGAVLPILHLNGFKISNPTLLARIGHEALEQFFLGCGWAPIFVEGDEPMAMHQRMAVALDLAVAKIHQIQRQARQHQGGERPLWPLIVLRSPKAWMQSYRPQELFDEQGTLRPELGELAPTGLRRMGSNPHANGGLLLRPLLLPDFREHARPVTVPGALQAQDTQVLGLYLRDVMRLNRAQRNFRLFGPDETVSNLLGAVFEVTNRQWDAETLRNDEFLQPDGLVLDSMLSEHQCQGWLEGYLLTGRHGLFNSYEAFVRIVDSMFSQHAKWLKVSRELPWRRPIASLNYLLASHVWQQDHNGYTHQDPGFIDHVLSKKPELVRVYLPPDANCLLAVADHCLRSLGRVNVVVACKHALPQWLGIEAAGAHCARGLGAWAWAGNEGPAGPDLVMACCGDTPTLEILAATALLREHLPELQLRVVNVVDLGRLQSPIDHAEGLSDADFDALFTRDKPVIFGFHGYPGLVHRLTHRRANRQLQVQGYQEEGTITTAFDMRVQNRLDRFHLIQCALECLPQLGARAEPVRQWTQERLLAHKRYIDQHGQDLPEIRDWRWPAASAGRAR